MDLPRESVGVVRKPLLGQIVLYSGCCCGKTECGFAPVPRGASAVAAAGRVGPVV
jgi:hypothetical protein